MHRNGCAGVIDHCKQGRIESETACRMLQRGKEDLHKAIGNLDDVGSSALREAALLSYELDAGRRYWQPVPLPTCPSAKPLAKAHGKTLWRNLSFTPSRGSTALRSSGAAWARRHEPRAEEKKRRKRNRWAARIHARTHALSAPSTRASAARSPTQRDHTLTFAQAHRVVRREV